MPLTKSDYEAIMKTHYTGPIRDLLNNTAAFLGRMERYTEPTGGNFLHIPVRTGRTSSIGSRDDGASEMLPEGDKPEYNKATYKVKSHYATVRITGLAIRSARSDNFAFARAQVRDMEDTVKDFKKDINRQIFADGSGELCQCVSSTGSGTITVTVNSNLYPTNPTKFLYAGMKVDGRTITTGAGDDANANSMTIASVPSTTTFTYVGTDFTAQTTDMICREDNVGVVTFASAGVSKEMFGLWALVDDEDPDAIWSAARPTGNVGGLDRASVPQWQGNVLTNPASAGTTRPFSVNLVQQGIDVADIAASGVTSLLQTNHAIWRVYGSLLAAAKTVEMSKMKLDGGWDALDLNGIPMVKDVECPDYVIFCLDENTFMLGVTGDWEWIEDDGGGVLSRLVRQDQYEGVMNRDMEMMIDNPARNTKIEDIAHS